VITLGATTNWGGGGAEENKLTLGRVSNSFADRGGAAPPNNSLKRFAGKGLVRQTAEEVGAEANLMPTCLCWNPCCRFADKQTPRQSNKTARQQDPPRAVARRRKGGERQQGDLTYKSPKLPGIWGVLAKELEAAGGAGGSPPLRTWVVEDPHSLVTACSVDNCAHVTNWLHLYIIHGVLL
jgi:hypothetical protein